MALFISLFLFLAGLQGQSREIRVRAFGFEDGLSHRNVFQIGQDTAGFLWLATAQGLNRFDGHRFKAWSTGGADQYLPCNFITNICFTGDDKIALACTDGSSPVGLVLFDPFQNIFDSILLSEKSALQHQVFQISNLQRGPSFSIWASAFLSDKKESWLLKTDEKGALREVVQLPGAYEARPMMEMDGDIYVGAHENELWAFDKEGRIVRQIEFPAPFRDPSFSRIIQLQSDEAGTLWVLLDHGQVYFLPQGAATFVRHRLSDLGIDNVRSSAFLIEEDGDIWLTGVIAAENSGADAPCNSMQPGASLLRYESASGLLEDFSYYLKQAQPYAEPPRQMFRDRTGVIWIASEFGLIQLVESDLFARYLSDGSECCRDGICSARGICEDDQGNIYISYYNSIHVLNPKNNSLTPFFSQQIGEPFGLLFYKGGLWTGEGLRIDVHTLQIDTLIPSATGTEGVVMLDQDKTLWFGYRDTLCYLDSRTKVISNFKDPSGLLSDSDFKNITHLFQGKTGGYIWAATQEDGIFKIQKGKGALRHYNMRSNPSLPHHRILALAESNGQLWIGSANGLAKLDIRNDKLTTYTTENGLSNNFINGILTEGDSIVWLSTDNGLSRFDVPSGRFTNFYESDGLSKNEFNRISFYRAKDGRMYFGGINGVNAFYPGHRYSHRQDKAYSRLLFTEFSRYDGLHDHRQTCGLSSGKPIELSFRDEIFSFWFSLADFEDPKAHLYSYMLEGYDKEWSKASPVNFARFFNIPAGRYHMRIRASRSGEDWVGNELNIPIIIHEAFYKTWWFQMLLSFTALAGIYSFFRYRVRRLEAHEKELEQLVQKRTLDLNTEKQKSEKLLLNILPAGTAEELKQHGVAKARRFDQATVLFSDFKGFSLLAGEMEPEALVAEIDFYFRAFDEIIGKYELEKIKTIGDAYLCAGGITENHNPVETATRVAQAALDIQIFLKNTAKDKRENGRPVFEARIGIHSGPVIAGIVGSKKFAYDIWGDTVNIAERLQTGGEVGKVNVSRSVYELIKGNFSCTFRGAIEAKHGRQVEMFFVDSPRNLSPDEVSPAKFGS